MKIFKKLFMFVLSLGFYLGLMKLFERNHAKISEKDVQNPIIRGLQEELQSKQDLKTQAVTEMNKILETTIKHIEQKKEESFQKEDFIASELSRLRFDKKETEKIDSAKMFQIARDWVEERQIYPHFQPEMENILKAIATAKIVKADGLSHGTQAKLSFELEGYQRVEFRPKRFRRGYIPPGEPNGGYDRHNAEIAAFHLDRILDFRRAPLAVGRVINLNTEIKPVATEKLIKTFRQNADGNTCYFGTCPVCNESRMVCADGEYLEGSVTMWLPKEWSNFSVNPNPFYFNRFNETLLAPWQSQKDFCDSVIKKSSLYHRGPRLLDVTDTFVFDYLIGNSDRHSFESFQNDGMIVLLDNAKSFIDPNYHEERLLTPLGRCCILRNSTWITLNKLQGGVLSQLLQKVAENDPIAPILDPSRYNALNFRLERILRTMWQCINNRGFDKVIVNEWKGF